MMKCWAPIHFKLIKMETTTSTISAQKIPADYTEFLVIAAKEFMTAISIQQMTSEILIALPGNCSVPERKLQLSFEANCIVKVSPGRCVYKIPKHAEEIQDHC
ncbi:hypothetical protein ILUMI_10319 [Ignelater luminosus]|uniref:Uncharacterized protein n=1 Tax=Ignelater luminosus TaxID=2038154 RepID=A0A8K0D2B2_IGNLU|nr:hypothetical protein ILUMI_10319 [Ignelater luminosus]